MSNLISLTLIFFAVFIGAAKAQEITSEPLTLQQGLPSDHELQKKFEEADKKNLLQKDNDQSKNLATSFEKKEAQEFKPRFGFTFGLGLPSIVTYSFAFFNGREQDIAVMIQGGQGQHEASVSYRDRHSEIIFLANRSRAKEEWSRFYGIGLGRQDFQVEANLTDSSGNFINEKETFDKTYLKFLFSMNYFKSNNIFWGADIGITYPISIESDYYANNAESDEDIRKGSYLDAQTRFQFFKSLFGSGISLQVTLVRWGWHF